MMGFSGCNPSVCRANWMSVWDKEIFMFLPWENGWTLLPVTKIENLEDGSCGKSEDLFGMLNLRCKTTELNPLKQHCLFSGSNRIFKEDFQSH